MRLMIMGVLASAPAIAATPALAADVTVTFSDVAPGTYAAAAVQDTNGDGTVTIGKTGPTEPYGFSGPAQTGIPKFGPASQHITSAGGMMTVTLSPPSTPAM